MPSQAQSNQCAGGLPAVDVIAVQVIRKSAFEMGQMMVFGPGGGPTGHARGFGMETDAKRSQAEKNEGILVGSQKPKRKFRSTALHWLRFTPPLTIL
jgi:hypothetical protein